MNSSLVKLPRRDARGCQFENNHTRVGAYPVELISALEYAPSCTNEHNISQDNPYCRTDLAMILCLDPWYANQMPKCTAGALSALFDS